MTVSTHFYATRIKRLIALIGLCVYLFVGMTSPEAASAFLLQVEGPHEVSVVNDFSGQAAVVFHHHHLSKGQDDTVFHQSHHQVEPDHVYVFPKRADQTSSISEGHQLAFKPLFIELHEFCLSAVPLKIMGVGNPELLAQPPPGLLLATELRRFTVLLL
jgi:hypothetical protein